MCAKPVLQQLDFKKVFYLQTDASAYGMGAVLSQEGGTMTSNSPNSKPRRHPIAYYSNTFTPTEQNYDIYEREFLGVVKALEHWHPYLIWTEQLFIIETNHKNLTYWKSPKKLTGRMAHWHEKLQDYNFKIVHISEKTNTPANALSQPNGQDIQESTKETSLISPKAFLRIFGPDLDDSLETQIVNSQRQHQKTMKEWAKDLPIHELDRTIWKDISGDRLVVPPDNEVKREILWVWHEHKGGGHRVLWCCSYKRTACARKQSRGTWFKEMRQRGGSPQRLIRRLEQECGLDTK